MKEKFDLSGKVAIVTGASKGIGESIAMALAEYGTKVVVASRKQDAVDEVAQKIKSVGFEATGVACHVGDEAQLAQLVKKTVELYGGVDILINNAAINPAYGPLTASTSALFDKTMNVNVRACMLLANLCHPIMKQRGGGSIVNISSVEGLKPSDGLVFTALVKQLSSC